MIELYHHGSSVCAAKVRLVLYEKGLEWTGHYLDILRGDQFDPDYLRLNPKAVVPTLIHDGNVVRESTVICEYLDEAFPDPPLKPADPLAQVRMRLWTKLVDEKLHPVCAVLTFISSHRHVVREMPPAEFEDFFARTPDPQKRARKRQWVEQGFAAPDAENAVRTYDSVLADMEAALADDDWLAGEGFSLADIAVTPYINRLDMLGMAGMWASRPRLSDWFARITARPSHQPAIYQWVPDPLLRALAENGGRSWPQVKAILDAA